ncbi:MAG: hypothetical protein HY236_04570 [Acidobacteria bacterium]|nr:hypothetical protein [Acidobacteriota bacterium]
MHLFSWWPGLVIFIPVTVVVDLIAARIDFIRAFALRWLIAGVSAATIAAK